MSLYHRVYVGKLGLTVMTTPSCAQATEREQKSTHPETARASARTEGSESGRAIGEKDSEEPRERAKKRKREKGKEASEYVSGLR